MKPQLRAARSGPPGAHVRRPLRCARAATLDHLPRRRARTSSMREVDPDKYERIVLNLLSNAFKFTPDDGWIRCRLEMSGAQRVLLTVQDSGPGIDRELRSEIFDRFHQGRSTSPHHAGGTGLGLAIVKDFVDLHGGTITVTDAPGGGAVFQVELPLSAPETTYVRVGTRTTDPTDTCARQDGRPVTCAAETGSRSSTPRRPGHSCSWSRTTRTCADSSSKRSATSARVGWPPTRHEALALAILRADPPDLVVTDLMMPELSRRATRRRDARPPGARRRSPSSSCPPRPTTSCALEPARELGPGLRHQAVLGPRAAGASAQPGDDQTGARRPAGRARDPERATCRC